MICDGRAIQHILHNNYIYTKPSFLQYLLTRILGDGVPHSFPSEIPTHPSFFR